MQRTTERVKVLVGEDKQPIVLTDSAVEALQDEAAGQAQEGVEAVAAIPASDFSALPLGDLLALRDHLIGALGAVEVLIECRPLDELEADDA